MVRQLEPQWLPAHCLHSAEISPQLSEWLTLTGSMTVKLRQCSRVNFQVNMLLQQWQQPRYSERRCLNLAKHQPTIVRETELLVDQQVWIFARSVFPAGKLSGRNAAIYRLGNQSLGDILFTDKKLQRLPFEFAHLRAGHTDYMKAVRAMSNPPARLWARRSVFILDRVPFLVNEIFLPTICSKNGRSV